jgi:hypothetical protein
VFEVYSAGTLVTAVKAAGRKAESLDEAGASIRFRHF